MARLNVNPTRMELAVLKERLNIATSGHKILKDKQDGLIRNFIELTQQNVKLREEVESLIKNGMQIFALAKALLHEEYLEQISLVPAQNVRLDVDRENLWNVKVPEMHFTHDKGSQLKYGYLNSNADLDQTLNSFHEVLPKLLELAELEKTCQLLAGEIERTRRRVNALEERTIPDLKETIKYIHLKLDENERAEITRLMKVKDFK